MTAREILAALDFMRLLDERILEAVAESHPDDYVGSVLAVFAAGELDWRGRA